MRISFYVGMGALLACLFFAPTLIEGMFAWCVLLAIAGAIWLLSPHPEEREPKL